MAEHTELIVGAYYNYTPNTHHCREGIAVVKRTHDGGLRVSDTFWSADGDDEPMGGGYRISYDEMDTLELRFNPADGWTRTTEDVTDYERSDVATVFSQHGLREAVWLRDGAKPSKRQRIENAELQLRMAKDELSAAQSAVDWAERKLQELLND